jgi:hypothetical protein
LGSSLIPGITALATGRGVAVGTAAELDEDCAEVDFSAFDGTAVGAAAALEAGAADWGIAVAEEPQATSTSNSNASGMKITVRSFPRNWYDIRCPPEL